MGRAVMVEKSTSRGLEFSVERMVKTAQDCRKDEVMIDFSRQIATRFAEMVEHFSKIQGYPVSAHNNKTLFLEGIDIWFRKNFQNNGSAPVTRDAKDVIVHAMAPWYQAMRLDDPSKYRGSITPPPCFTGDYVEVVALMLGCCACLEIQPLQFRFGTEDGVPLHVWARVHADGKWYDSDVMEPTFKLGDVPKFQKYEDVEIPL
jgi:hypothetical protein